VERRISLQAKIALVTSLALIAAGTAAIIFFERNGAMETMSWGQRIWGSVFQSITARTAGFNTLTIGDLTTPTLLFLIFLMFIGASPGSTGGGIKTCTFAVLAVTVRNMLKNNPNVKVFNRTVPRQVVRESLVIFFLASAWIFVFTIVLVYLRGRTAGGDVSLVRTLFEVVSAFGTVGLSTGITGGLDSASKLCLTATMFAGRIGPLTLALAVAFRGGREAYTYPEEDVMVG
jgi:trk system potassium uptake protein TrkH